MVEQSGSSEVQRPGESQEQKIERLYSTDSYPALPTATSHVAMAAAAPTPGYTTLFRGTTTTRLRGGASEGPITFVLQAFFRLGTRVRRCHLVVFMVAVVSCII